MNMSRYYHYKIVKSWEEKFAWIPKRTASKKWVWFDYYYNLHYKHEDDGTKCFQSQWYTTYTSNEYLLMVLYQKDQDETYPPE